MKITGQNFLGSQRSGKGDRRFSAINPETSTKLSPDFLEASEEEVHTAIVKAHEAFKEYRQIDGLRRAEFLECIADEIENLGGDLIQRCCAETGLPEARITGERARTTNQLRLFSSVLREGSWVQARIDTGDPSRTPIPKPDLRNMQIALGPVGIFGASNFPLAFSVAGGDTASALAAGCTVVIKAHWAHPGTSEMIGSAILKAIQECAMPDGTFSMVHGKSVDVGMAIVNHPNIKAIGFTGSFAGGKAIFDAAARRTEPIPVYAEMGSVNPVFILPGAMRSRGNEIASGLASSISLGVGQFCTNPGVVITEGTELSENFYGELANNIAGIEAGIMLTDAIHKAYDEKRNKLMHEPGVKELARGRSSVKSGEGEVALFQVNSVEFLENNHLEEEVFGPSSLMVSGNTKEDLLSVASKIGGHLTASVFAEEDELEDYRDLILLLEQKVGRLIINGFPTGVEVSHAMNHGGPFPATTNDRTTSVGTTAMYRFTRPVCYQNFPDRLLPEELKEKNPRNIWRLLDGEWTR